MAVALLAGCSDDGGDDEPIDEPTESAPVDEAEPEVDEAPDDTEPDEPDPDVEDAEEPDDDQTEEEEAAEPPSSDPLATVEHPVTDLGATLRVDVVAIEVVGELLRVAVTFTPQDLDDESSLAEMMGSSGSGNGISGRLIDAENLLEYTTVRAAVPHGSRITVVDGHPVTLYFYFAAPEQPMTSFDLQFDFGSGHPDLNGVVDIPFETS